MFVLDIFFWLYSANNYTLSLFLYIWLLGPNFAGAQFAGARTRGPICRGPICHKKLPGAQFATKNHQGPILPVPNLPRTNFTVYNAELFFGFSNIAAIFVQGMEREEKNILGLPSGYCWILIIRVVESSCDPDSSRKRFPPSKPLALRVTRLTRSLCRSNRYY